MMKKTLTDRLAKDTVSRPAKRLWFGVALRFSVAVRAAFSPVALPAVEKLDPVPGFGWRSAFSAAVKALLSLAASAAEVTNDSPAPCRADKNAALGPLRFAISLAFLTVAAWAAGQTPAPVPLPKVLDRASQRVSDFLDLFSNVKCVEQVTQTKLKPNGKVELEETSSFDYLVILTNAGGDLSLDESRLPLKQATADRKKDVSMLLSNGFATLFLVFHPYYASSFEFTDAGSEMVDGHNARKLHFVHIRNTRSIAALALRGREYPLELSGDAWVDPETGNILRIEATIGSTLEDVGMKSLQASVQFAPVAFSKDQPVYWFPSEAVVEVETPKQHWRNTHRFTSYKQFSVSTEEHVASK